MKLLDFNVPPFVRINYASAEIKEKWEPKIRKAEKVYYALELQTVIHGIRRATTRHVRPEELDYFVRELARMGLYFLPIHRVGVYKGFAHTMPPVEDGKPYTFYGVVAKRLEDAELFYDCHKPGDAKIDHSTIGDLLGYPKCCQEFFNTVWASGYIDPVWQQAERLSDEYIKTKTETKIVVKDNIYHELSPMLRYIGVRFVPHIPCSLGCEHSAQMVKDWVQLARDLKLDGTDDLINLLHMPISWDALKGIAVIRTPLFKVTTNSVACYPKYVVEKHGDFYPEGVPTGLTFPWKVPEKVNKIHELRRLQAEGKIPVLK